MARDGRAQCGYRLSRNGAELAAPPSITTITVTVSWHRSRLALPT